MNYDWLDQRAFSNMVELTNRSGYQRRKPKQRHSWSFTGAMFLVLSALVYFGSRMV
jgi:hypothetical protein